MSIRPGFNVSFYKKLFLFAAFWNFGAGMLGLVSMNFNIKSFYGMADYAEKADMLFKLHYYNFWLFITIMSLGFYFTSRDVIGNYAVAIIAIFGKSVSVIIWAYYYFIGQATFMVLVAGAGDLILVIFFIRYLMARGIQPVNNQ